MFSLTQDYIYVLLLDGSIIILEGWIGFLFVTLNTLLAEQQMLKGRTRGQYVMTRPYIIYGIPWLPWYERFPGWMVLGSPFAIYLVCRSLRLRLIYLWYMVTMSALSFYHA